jgi:hypothetical protein
MSTTAAESQPVSQPGRTGRKALAALGWVPLALVLLLTTAWAAAALYFDVRLPWLRLPLCIGYLLAIGLVWFRVRGCWWKVGLSMAAFTLVLGWWLTLRPSNQRDWLPDVAVLPYADIEGDRVLIHNVRDCDYRSETDFAVRHYDQAYDLAKLRTADLYMVYWGSPSIAHTMISFGFAGDRYVCFSIETRKEKGEGYSALKGLFRQFELAYIVADERDVVRLRTNYRKGEDAYLFRLQATPAQIRTLFLDYLRRVNDLHRRPEWYSALTQNCTTSIRTQRTAAERAPWDWRMLANGYGDQMLYERGLINTNLPLSDLKQKSLVNARAREADQAPDFSRRIRQGIPGMEE